MPKINIVEKQRKRLEKIFYPSHPSDNPMTSTKALISTSKDFLSECEELMEIRLLMARPA